MATVTISINSREYAIACEDGQERRILQLSRLLDEKAQLLTQGTSQISENMLLAMVALLLADELSETQKGGAAAAPTPPPLDTSKLTALDQDLSKQIKSLDERLKSLAKIIESL